MGNIDNKCLEDDCYKTKEPDYNYCTSHIKVCDVLKCKERCMKNKFSIYSSTTYTKCEKHLEMCEFEECYQQVGVYTDEMTYCYVHVCKYIGCNAYNDNMTYCTTHKCTDNACNMKKSQDKPYCTYHACNIPKCQNINMVKHIKNVNSCNVCVTRILQKININCPEITYLINTSNSGNICKISPDIVDKITNHKNTNDKITNHKNTDDKLIYLMSTIDS